MTIETRKEYFRLSEEQIRVWPADQEAELLCERPTIVSTCFADADRYRQPLIDRVLELEKDPAFTHHMQTGSSKVENVHQWNLPEAGFIQERALSFYIQVAKRPGSKVDLCWATVYRNGDYLTPHSHDRATGTLVYCLDAGDPDYEKNLFSGKLVFADPRIDYCCNAEENCVTRPLQATMREGTMVLFPGPIVHFVHPYIGSRPRITLTWNVN